MRFFSLFIAAIFSVFVFTNAAFADDAIAKGGLLSGTLRLVKSRLPDGKAVETYQIASSPRQMDVGDDVCTNPDTKASTFHLFAKTDKGRAQLSRLIGKKIRVHVWELFCTQNVWRVGDAGVSKWSW